MADLVQVDRAANLITQHLQSDTRNSPGSFLLRLRWLDDKYAGVFFTTDMKMKSRNLLELPLLYVP